MAQRGPDPEHTPPSVCSPTLPNPRRGDKKLQAIQQIDNEHVLGTMDRSMKPYPLPSRPHCSLDVRTREAPQHRAVLRVPAQLRGSVEWRGHSLQDWLPEVGDIGSGS